MLTTTPSNGCTRSFSPDSFSRTCTRTVSPGRNAGTSLRAWSSRTFSIMRLIGFTRADPLGWGQRHRRRQIIPEYLQQGQAKFVIWPNLCQILGANNSFERASPGGCAESFLKRPALANAESL